MRKIFPIALLIIVVILFGIFYTGLVQEAPTNPSNENGLVEQAYEYCSQFTEESCSTNAYLSEGTQEAIKCYWNSENSECWAGIGYQ